MVWHWCYCELKWSHKNLLCGGIFFTQRSFKKEKPRGINFDSCMQLLVGRILLYYSQMNNINSWRRVVLSSRNQERNRPFQSNSLPAICDMPCICNWENFWMLSFGEVNESQSHCLLSMISVMQSHHEKQA